MDWTAVLEEDGAEMGDWERKWRSRVSFLASFSSSAYTPFVAFLFTVNYILGVGCLGMPKAFYTGGILLGVILTVSCSLLSYVTTCWVAHAGHRVVQGRQLMKGNPFRSPKQLRKKQTCTVSGTREEATSIVEGGPVLSLYRSISGTLVVNNKDKNREDTQSASSPSRRRKREEFSTALPDSNEDLEVVDIVEDLLGSNTKVIYQCSLCALTMTGLVAYTQVFVHSFMSQSWANVPQWLLTAAFGGIVVPLSCLDLDEQVQTQIVMSVLRFASLAIMLVGMLVAIVHGSSIRHTTSTLDHGSEGLPLLDMRGFVLMFSTAVFSQLFQHSVPGLIRPLAEEKRRAVPAIFFSALMTTALIYCFISIVSCYHLGNDIQQSINLNFVGFTWGVNEDSMWLSLALGLSLIVVLFPALDTISIFPLIAITLGNNMRSISPGLMKPIARQLLGSDSENTEEDRHHKKVISVLWRLVASVSPLILSLVVNDLSLSLQVGGICGIIVAFIIPSLLQLEACERLLRTPPIYHSSPYQTHVTSIQVMPFFVLAFSAVALALCVMQTIGMLSGN